MHKPTPWRAWFSLAVTLGLQPESFWRLSLREWRAIAVQGGDDLLPRGAFEVLAARFPDQPR